MKRKQKGKLSLMTCRSGESLGERIYESLKEVVGVFDEGLKYVKSEEIWFPNGEVKTVIEENIRGDDLYILQSMDDPLSGRTVNDNLMALFTAIDAAYQSDVEEITVLIPQYPYSRQEKKQRRECISGKIIASFLEELEVDRVITMDVHAEAIVGFFRRIKFENLHASRVIMNHFERNYSLNNLMVVSPDIGGAERGRFFAKELKVDLAIVYKQRNYELMGEIQEMRLIGDVEGKNILIVDDMIGTGKTLLNACEMLRRRGAKEIYLSGTFAFLNGDAIKDLRAGYECGLIQKLIGTDCVFRGAGFIEENEWYEEVSISDLIARVIYNINCKKSVSKLLD